MAAQREAGLMATGTKGQLVGKDASGGFVCNPPEEKPITLAEAGIDKNLADRARNFPHCFLCATQHSCAI